MKNLFLFAIMILFFATLGNAQIPDKFTNLEVLSKDISKRELIGNMRSFAIGLGVRCHFCHVGEGNDFSTFDFAADDKPQKKKARVMIQMRDAINKQYLTQLGEENALQVNCVTCHRGYSEPVTLQQVLIKVISEEGIQAGIKKYRELRQRYYGGFTFDFHEQALINLGYAFLGKKENENAIEIFKLNVEMHQESFNGYDSLGEAYMKAGNKELAIVNYKKSLELNPNNKNAETMIEKLKEE